MGTSTPYCLTDEPIAEFDDKESKFDRNCDFDVAENSSEVKSPTLLLNFELANLEVNMLGG